MYDRNRINPERLARQRAQSGRRFRIHLFVLAFVATWALILIPFRGRAHMGPLHLAAAYNPPQTEAAATSGNQELEQIPAAPQDVHYLRAPLVLDGVSQARAGGVPLQTRSIQSPGQTAPVAPGPQIAPAATPGADSGATSDGQPDATPTRAPIDTPQRPNDIVQVIPTPEVDRNDPVDREAAYAALQDLTRPLYYDHVVQPGDTVSTIAALYGIASDTVLWNNPLIVDRNALFIGQTLRLPAKNGVLYNVHYGDTLNDIADSYQVEPTALLSLAANGLADAGSLKEGQTVLIVGGQPPAPPPPPPAAVTPSPTPSPEPSATPPAPAASATRAPAPAPPTVASSTWIWPAHGPISSYFGPGHPLGIDISQGAGGQPIIAARAGTVTFAGGDACCSYGYYVDINHGGGFSSRYGHFRSWPIVAVGQHVNQGQALGYAGSTGYSTGPHLHFEIHINGAIVNPLNYLPPGGN